MGMMQGAITANILMSQFRVIASACCPVPRNPWFMARFQRDKADLTRVQRCMHETHA